MDTDKANTETPGSPKGRTSKRRNEDGSDMELGSKSPSRRSRRSAGGKRRDGDVDKSERRERREREDREAKDRSRRSRDSDVDKSERRERREREDREAKDRARRGKGSGGVSAAGDAERRERRERRTREDQEAKDRARAGRRQSSSLSTSERREREDREAKDRARSRRSGEGSTRTSRVGAFSETDGPKSPRKGSGDRSHRKGSSSRKESERKDREAKAKSRSGSRAARPGVESVASSRDSGRDRRRREKEQEQKDEIPVAPNLDAEDPVKMAEDEFAVEAIKIDEEGEANERARKQDEENEKLRQQMQEMADRQRAAEERAEREKEEAKKRQKRILCAVLIFFLFVGGGVVAYLLTRSSGDEPSSPDTAEDPTPANPSNETTDSPVPNTTSAPTTGLSSNSPTSTPTVPLLFDPPTTEDCEAMKNGDVVFDQDSMEEHTFAIGMDVSFSSNVDFENVYVPELEQAIQEYLAPALAQCPSVTGRRRRLRSGEPDRFVVGNAAVSAEHNKDETCNQNAGVVCFRLSVTLRVWLKGEIDKVVLTVTTLVADAFNKGPTGPNIVELLKLPTPYVRFELVSVQGLDPTNAPTSSPSTVPTDTMVPSQTPTSKPSMAPVIGPTTEQPTDAPSSGPTMQPVVGPTTEQPTEAPSSGPTTQAPSSNPTDFPTGGTPSPTTTTATTATPTSSPTPVPTSFPTSVPTAGPTFAPTPTPTVLASSIPTIETPTPSLNPSVAPSSAAIPLITPSALSSQSSNYECMVSVCAGTTLAVAPGLASAAIDGNNEPSYYSGTLTHTDIQYNPFWQVDLGVTATVKTVVVWNRVECGVGSPLDAIVELLDNANVVVGSQSISTSERSVSLDFGGVAGVKVVKIRKEGWNNMVLSEVQVFDTDDSSVITNGVAVASQSSNLGCQGCGYSFNGVSEKAIDGNTDGNIFNGSVSKTWDQVDPWWGVNLGLTGAVKRVIIYNRTDGQQEFIVGAIMELRDGVGSLLASGTVTSGAATSTFDFDPPVSGVENVLIRLETSGAYVSLTIAEVEVFGWVE